MKNLVYFFEIIKPGITLWVGITAFGSSIISQDNFDFIKSFLISLFVMLSSAGSSVLNNYFDRDIDKLMKRTRNRVLASNKINSKIAISYGFLLCIIGLIGIFRFSFIAFLLDLIAIISYSFVYTFLKRKTPFSLIIGSIPGALPTLIGYAAIKNEVDVLAFSLFALMFLWQHSHFIYLSILAKDDYENARIPAISIIYGENYSRVLSFVYSLSLFPLVLMIYSIADLSKLFFIFLVILSSFWLILNFLYYKRLAREKLMFISSNYYILLIFIMITVDKFML